MRVLKNRWICSISIMALLFLFSMNALATDPQDLARFQKDPKLPHFLWPYMTRYVMYGDTTLWNKILYSPALTGTVVLFGATTFWSTLTGDAIYLGRAVLDSLGRVLIYVQNKTGSALAEGDACVWDNTAVEVVASAAISDDMTIADDLTDEEAFLSVTIVSTGTPDSGDSMFVKGKIYGALTSTTYGVELTNASGPTDMVTNAGTLIYFTDVDSVYGNADAIADGASAIVVNAYGVATVKACDGANTDVAGVAIGAIADNAFGYICTYGVCKATVDAATTAASPGVLLEGAANGDLVVDAAATTGKNIGRALEYSNKDNTKILVFIDCY